MSMFYEGRIHTFPLSTWTKDICVIRPLVYSEEKDIKGFIKSQGITIPSLPHDRQNLRKLVGDYLKISRIYPW